MIAVGALHASTGQVAWLTALTWTPNIFAIVRGAWVDRRTGRRRLMVIADLVRACLLLTLPAAYLFGAVTLGRLYAVALVSGAADVLFNTAYPPFFVHLVPRAAYVEANSRLSAGRSASYVAGPALAGALVQVLTAPVAVVADALSFLVSAVLVGTIPVHEPPPPAADASARTLPRRVGEGLVFVG